MRKFSVWSRDKRALSPIFATVLLASIIIIFGSVAYYYASNLTSTATNNYVNTLSDSQQAMSERIAFENVVYDQSSATLTVFILNCGSANNVQINSVFLYNSGHNIIGVYSGNAQISGLSPMGTPITGNALNVGQEGYFTVTLVPAPIPPITSGSIYTYTIHLVTKSGSSFDYAFKP